MEKVKVDELTIEGVVYVPKESQQILAMPVDGLKYCVVRTYSAGVHIGFVSDLGVKNPQHAVLYKSRRLHYWDNACSLSQVAMDGVDEVKSRIAVELPEIELTDIIEVIPCSTKAADLFKNAKAWKK